jgi:hypothetical protein
MEEDHAMTPESVLVFTPAVRMLLIEAAYQEDGTFEIRYHPIIAIECRAERITGGETRAGRPRPDRLFGTYHPLVVANLYGSPMLTTEDDLADAMNVDTELVACPWPAHEDFLRLEQAVRAVKERAREKALSNPAWREAHAPTAG